MQSKLRTRKRSVRRMMVVITCVWASHCVAAETSSSISISGPPGGSTDTEMAFYHWGFTWYVQGFAAYDIVSWIEGGAEGSSILVYPAPTEQEDDPRETVWVFIDGKHLYLRDAGMTKKVYTNKKGYLVRSRERRAWEQLHVTEPEQAHLARLNSRLIELYKYSKDDKGVDTIRVVPFFVAPGWPDTTTTGPDGTLVSGARRDYVEQCLARLDLTLKLVAGQEQGYATKQDPEPGTLIPEGADPVVTVAFDGSRLPLIQQVSGDVPASAFDIKKWDAINNRAEITWAHSDEQGTPSCHPANTPSARDMFFRWKDDSETVPLRAEVTWADPPDTILSTWVKSKDGKLVELPANVESGDKPCDFAWPKISFTAEAGKEYFIVLEFTGDAEGTAKLKFDWTGKAAAAQSQN